MNNVTMKPVATKLVGSLMERAGLNESRVNNTARWEDLDNLKTNDSFRDCRLCQRNECISARTEAP